MFMFQLYPFGHANGDASVIQYSFNEAISTSITLRKSLYFYNGIIKTVYVSEI